MDTLVYGSTIAQLAVAGLELEITTRYETNGNCRVNVLLIDTRTDDIVGSYRGTSCEGIAYLIETMVVRHCERKVSEDDEVRS